MGFLSDLIVPLVALVVAVLGGAALRWSGRRAGKAEAEAEQHEDTVERLEAGRDRVLDNRGDDPAERLRGNDGEW